MGFLETLTIIKVIQQGHTVKQIIVIGEILVEIMADNLGEGFKETLSLTGPYASGAPAIFIDQVAKMGHSCAIISTVGDDDFGRLNLERLAGDGVDIRPIAVDRNRPTGSAFVRYRPSGERDFIFNIKHSACGRLQVNHWAEEVIATADHLHIMGSSITSKNYTQLNLRAAQSVKARGGTISFDPNLRKELFRLSSVKPTLEAFLSLTDLYLPSGDEIYLINEADNPEKAAQQLLKRGIKTIVHKLGAKGACYYDNKLQIYGEGFKVTEIDPTGAGDSFGGVMTALWLANTKPHLALKLANAAGALAVSAKGPMEGVKSLAEIEAFAARTTLTTE